MSPRELTAHRRQNIRGGNMKVDILIPVVAGEDGEYTELYDVPVTYEDVPVTYEDEEGDE